MTKKREIKSSKKN